MLQTRNQLNDLIRSCLGCHQVCWHFPAQCPVRFVQPLLCGFLVAFKQIYRPINDADNPYPTFTLFRVDGIPDIFLRSFWVILAQSVIRFATFPSRPSLIWPRSATPSALFNPATCQRRCGLAGVEDKLNVFIANLHLVLTLYPNGNTRANINHQQTEGIFPDCDTSEGSDRYRVPPRCVGWREHISLH